MPFDPVFLAFCAKLGIDAVSTIITSWQQSGSPTPDQIRQAFIVKRPEDYFNEPPQATAINDPTTPAGPVG